jgi:hypothetical protein
MYWTEFGFNWSGQKIDVRIIKNKRRPAFGGRNWWEWEGEYVLEIHNLCEREIIIWLVGVGIGIGKNWKGWD